MSALAIAIGQVPGSRRRDGRDLGVGWNIPISAFRRDAGGSREARNRVDVCETAPLVTRSIASVRFADWNDDRTFV